MPAYNAETTLSRTLAELDREVIDEVVLVDDASTDRTVPLARELGLDPICHEDNKGYGGNQKTCYRQAIDLGADVIVMVHPDYQYSPLLVPAMAAMIAYGEYDMVLGSRILAQHTVSRGMPVYKYLFNRLLTAFENTVTGQNLGEWHSGLRAYSRRCLETVPWEKNSDDFVFDQQFLIQAAILKLRLGDVPVAARYFEEASSINFRRSCVYGLSAMFCPAQYVLQRLGVARFALFEPNIPR